jgi:thymidylate synthase
MENPETENPEIKHLTFENLNLQDLHPNFETEQEELGNYPESSYLSLIYNILYNGNIENSRNGRTKSLFGYNMRFSLRYGTVPLLTTKRLAWKTCFHELMWFIRGSTNNNELIEKNVHIWDANGSREFLDSRGLTENEENDLGPVYGHQWRHFNAPYSNCHENYEGKGVDQLQNIIDMLKDPNQRNSRRLVLSAWNPCQLDEMALPPCHVLIQFYVKEDKYLSCSLYQRSGDVGLGVPFNIASYSFLTHIIAHHCGLIADEFVHFIGNAHIYENHLGALVEQLKRKPLNAPIMQLLNHHDSISDYDIDDISWIQEYRHQGTLKMEMSA